MITEKRGDRTYHFADTPLGRRVRTLADAVYKYVKEAK